MLKEIVLVDNNNDVQKLNKDLKQKDACLIYSMPGCPYCEQLDVELKKVEDRLGDFDHIGLIAKILNHNKDNVNVSDVEIDGFPTIVVSSSGKQKSKFEGRPRTEEELIKFLLENKIIKKKSKSKKLKKLKSTKPKSKKLKKLKLRQSKKPQNGGKKLKKSRKTKKQKTRNQKTKKQKTRKTKKYVYKK